MDYIKQERIEKIITSLIQLKSRVEESSSITMLCAYVKASLRTSMKTFLAYASC